MRIRDLFDPASGMEKLESRIRDKHPGSATLTTRLHPIHPPRLHLIHDEFHKVRLTHLLDQFYLAGRVNAPEAALARLLLASRNLHEVSATRNIIINMILLQSVLWIPNRIDLVLLDPERN
jgi:hypothetical protein